MSSPNKRRLTGGRAALAGACVVAGWLVHDLVVFLISGQPSVSIPPLLPGSALAVLIGAAVGWLIWLRPLPVALATLAATAAGSLAPRLLDDVDFSVAHSWLPRAMFLLTAALIATLFAAHRGLGAVRNGLALGLLACIVTNAVRFGEVRVPSWTLLWTGLLALAVNLVPRPSIRSAATVAVALIPVVWTVHRTSTWRRPVRPDLGPPPVAAAAGSPNLLLVVLDTVRADRLAPYGHERATTPRLDEFVRRFCTRYENARSTSSWTLSSHASLFTGLYPAVHGATHPREGEQEQAIKRAIRPAKPLRADVTTLAQILREDRGYRTAAIVGNSAYLFHAFGIDRGFEHYDDRTASNVRNYLALAQLSGAAHRAGHTMYRDADQISDLALDWLAEREGDEPFFLMLNYMDAHNPYMPPAPFHLAFADEQPLDPHDPPEDMLPLLYDRSMAFLDAQLARVLDELEARGLLEDTVVIVTSDHGEAFGEHETWTHAWTLYEEMIRVPLYVKPLGPREVEVVGDPISGVDVFPLALSLLGFARPPELRGGVVVGEWYHGHANDYIAEWGARTGHDPQADLFAYLDGDVKYIVESTGRVRAWDVRVDPLEQRPLELTDAQRTAALERARTWWADHPPVKSGDAVLDEASAELLKGLGYTGE